MICWTLGITEHHNAADNVLALINLGLLTGHVGTYGSGLNPLRGQNNVQGGGDMGAIPHHLTGFQEVENDPVAARFEQEWGSTINPKKGLAPLPDVRGDGGGRAHGALRDRREPGGLRGRQPAHAQAPRQPRHPDRPGHLPDAHREDGRRGVARRRTRRSNPRGPSRTANAASSGSGPPSCLQGTRRTTSGSSRSWRTGSVGTGAILRARHVGRGPARLADARRDGVGAARGARRDPVAVPGRRASRDDVPPRAAVVGRSRSAGEEGAVLRGALRTPGGRARRGLSLPAHHRPSAGLVQHRRADRRVHVAAPSRGDAGHLPRGRGAARAPRRGSGSGSCPDVARSRRRSGSRWACDPASCS